MKRLSSLSSALALLLAASGCDSGPMSPPVQAVISRCLIDSQTDAVYAANDDGGIDAVSLGSGRLLWSTKEATDPLAISQGRLLAWVAEPGKANCIRVVVLDKQGNWTRSLVSEPLVLPEWVSVPLAHGQTFQAQGHVEADDLILRWKAHAGYAGGPPIDREFAERFRKDASGAYRINLKTGKVSIVGPRELILKRPTRLSPELEKLATREYTDELGNPETKALVVEGHAVALDIQFVGPGRRLVLRRWSVKSGKELESVTLLEGPSVGFGLLPDGRSVLAGLPVAKENLPEGMDGAFIFSLPTGERLAHFSDDVPGQAATVVGKRFFSVTQGPMRVAEEREIFPRNLRVLDVNTGKLLWERPIASLRQLLPLP